MTNQAVETDIVVAGSGFAGSLMAMIARRLGFTVAMIERDSHPRFAIGESTTPLTNLLLKELAGKYDLPQLLPLHRWGDWQTTHPDMVCGLKRGFTFFQHRQGQDFDAATRRHQLLVAASPCDATADTHWFRADFDAFLVREAQSLGVAYFDRTKLDTFRDTSNGTLVEGRRDGKKIVFQAKFFIDATGQRGFLHGTLGLGECGFSSMPATQGLFAHFEGVFRWADLPTGKPPEPPPYPVDDAAVHHLFEDGWIWVLRFNNGITSAGLSASEKLAKELNLSEGSPAWHRALHNFPSVERQFAGARAVTSFVHSPRLAFRCERATGQRWAMLPSSVAFIDPLLSTGFPLTLLGIERLAVILAEGMEAPGFSQALGDYEKKTLMEADHAAGLIAAMYINMDDFEVFAALAFIYFTSVSFSESARRLGRRDLAKSFLLMDNPQFGPPVAECCTAAVGLAELPTRKRSTARESLLKRITEIIQPFNVTGLNDPKKRNWYPVVMDDLIRAASRFDVTPEAVREMIRREMGSKIASSV